MQPDNINYQSVHFKVLCFYNFALMALVASS
jgi:hypothetical protein